MHLLAHTFIFNSNKVSQPVNCGCRRAENKQIIEVPKLWLLLLIPWLLRCLFVGLHCCDIQCSVNGKSTYGRIVLGSFNFPDNSSIFISFGGLRKRVCK